MLSYINSTIDPDAVFWLGDSVSHNIDTLELDQVAEEMETITQLVNNSFPAKPVFAAIGNHDTFPMNDMNF